MHQRIRNFSATYSDARRIEEAMVAEGDMVAFNSRLEMTHTGEVYGVAGSNKHISVVEMGFIRIASGKIAEMWGLLDVKGLMQQIGALQPSDQPKST